jgi:hypothetical protein
MLLLFSTVVCDRLHEIEKHYGQLCLMTCTRNDYAYDYYNNIILQRPRHVRGKKYFLESRMMTTKFENMGRMEYLRESRMMTP